MDAESAPTPIGGVRQGGEHQQRVAGPDPVVHGTRFLHPEGRCNRQGHDQKVAGTGQIPPLRQSIEALAQRDGADAFRREPTDRSGKSVAMSLDGGGKRDTPRIQSLAAHEQRGEQQQRAKRTDECDQALAHTLTWHPADA